MRVRAKLLTMSAALPAVALLGDGCRTATQVTLDIGTNVVCADMRGVDIVIAGEPHDAEHRAALDAPGTRFATTTTTDCAEGALPRRVGTLAVTPSTGGGAVVLVAAFGNTRVSDCVAPSFGPGCIVARRKFGFVDHTSVTLPIVLDPICAGVPCDESSTCVGKKCVDSAVDCSSGTCSDPGQRTADGGLVEVDAVSPLDASGGIDAAEGGGGDAETDAAGDAAIGDGASDGGVVDAGGGGSCPMTPSCSGMPVGTCASVEGTVSACCYASTPASCGPLGSCPAISGCCRSAEDCTGGDICCASTGVAGPTTTIVCKSRSACMTAGGVAVCATQGNAGCGQNHVCIGSVYNTMPDYYGCS